MASSFPPYRKTSYPGDTMKVVVTGGRDYDNKRVVWTVLDDLHRKYDFTLLVTGACPYGGADLLAEQWAKENEVDYRGYPAKFKRTGKSAGPIRNKRMLSEVLPDLVVAFPGGTGTNGTVNLAIGMDIPVEDHRGLVDK